MALSESFERLKKRPDQLDHYMRRVEHNIKFQRTHNSGASDVNIALKLTSMGVYKALEEAAEFQHPLIQEWLSKRPRRFPEQTNLDRIARLSRFVDNPKRPKPLPETTAEELADETSFTIAMLENNGSYEVKKERYRFPNDFPIDLHPDRDFYVFYFDGKPILVTDCIVCPPGLNKGRGYITLGLLQGVKETNFKETAKKAGKNPYYAAIEKISQAVATMPHHKWSFAAQITNEFPDGIGQKFFEREMIPGKVRYTESGKLCWLRSYVHIFNPAYAPQIQSKSVSTVL